MYKTEILPHASDVKIKIEADSLEALFQAGLKSMSCLLKEDINEKENDLPVACMVELHAGDTTALLIDFLSEVLTISYTEKAVFSQLNIKSLGKNYIQASIHGTRINGFDEDVKAVTYHEADVRQISGHWVTNIIFDI